MVTTTELRFMKYSDTTLKRWLSDGITFGILGGKKLTFSMNKSILRNIRLILTY